MSKYQKATIAIIILAILVRIFLISIYTVSGDACWHYSVSKFIAEEKTVPLFENLGREEPFWAPPLFHVSSALGYQIFGNAGLTFIPVLFGSLAIIIPYLVFRRILSEKATFFATAFIAFIPIMIDYSLIGYVESMLVFFTTLSLYFIMRDKIALSAIAAGLAILTKYNGVFIIPVLLFILYKKHELKKPFFTKTITLGMISAVISLPWFIRNWIQLGNPVWPFVNFIFKGLEKDSYTGLNPEAIISAGTYLATYLGFVGVPDGNYKTLLFFTNPIIQLGGLIFLIGTIIFFIPLFFSYKSKKSKENYIFYAMFASFFILFLIYVANVGPFVSRILLPGLIGIAFFYGKGMETLLNLKHKHKKIINKLIITVFLLICLGFVVVETAKFTLATKEWNKFEADFNWVQQFTKDSDIFLVSGQCVQYHIDRRALFASNIDTNNYQYVWVNKDFKLDINSVLTNEQIKAVKEKATLTYQNKKTGTEIYRVN